MKLFILRATTDEQKKDQAILIRLYAVFIISLVFLLATFALCLEINGEKVAAYSRLQFMFFIVVIGHIISMAPSIMRYSWKQIIIISSVTSIFLGLFFAATLRFL